MSPYLKDWNPKRLPSRSEIVASFMTVQFLVDNPCHNLFGTVELQLTRKELVGSSIQASTKVRVMRGYGGESLGKFVTNSHIRRPSEIVRQKWLFPKMTTLVRFPISFVQSVLSNQFSVFQPTPQNLVRG